MTKIVGEDIQEWCLKMKQQVPPCAINKVRIVESSLLEIQYFTTTSTSSSSPICEWELLVEYGGSPKRPFLSSPFQEGAPNLYWHKSLTNDDIVNFANRLRNLFPFHEPALPQSPLDGKELRIVKKPNFQSIWKVKGPRNEAEQQDMITKLSSLIESFFAAVLALPLAISKSRLVLELFLPSIAFHCTPPPSSLMDPSTALRDSNMEEQQKQSAKIREERNILLKLIYNSKKSLIRYRSSEDLLEVIKAKFGIAPFKGIEMRCKDEVDGDYVVIDGMDDLDTFIDFRPTVSKGGCHLNITIVDQ